MNASSPVSQKTQSRAWNSIKLYILVLAYVLDVHFVSLGLLFLFFFTCDPAGKDTRLPLTIAASACYALSFAGSLFYVVKSIHPLFLRDFFAHLRQSKVRQRALIHFLLFFVFGFLIFHGSVSSIRTDSGASYTIGFYLGLMRFSLFSSVILALLIVLTIYATGRIEQARQALSLQKHLAAESCLLSWHFIWRSFLLFTFIALCISFAGWMKQDYFFNKLIGSGPLILNLGWIFGATSFFTGFFVTDTVLKIRKRSSLSLPILISSDWQLLNTSFPIHIRLFLRSLSLIIFAIFILVYLLLYWSPTYSATLAISGCALIACTFYSLWTLLHEPAFKLEFDTQPTAPLEQVEVNNHEVKKHCVLVRGPLTPKVFGVRDFPGCDISQLKPDVDFSASLATIEEISKAGSHLHLLLVGACLYSVIAACNVAEADLIAGGTSIKLPVAEAELPVVGFFIVGPIVILIVFTFFHLYLSKLWQHLSWMPARFNDGSSLDSKIYPWVLSSPVDFHFPVLAKNVSPFNWISLAVTVISAWLVAPLTCVFFWYGYLRKHDWVVTSWQLFFIWVATVLALYFYEKSAETLNGGTEEFLANQPARLRSGVIFSIFLIIAFLLVSVVAHVGRRIPLDFIYSDLNGEMLSSVSNDWDGIDLSLVTGKNFSHASFHGASARQVRLPKADLSNCDISEADFELADLREANLCNAKFLKTNLSASRLDQCVISGTKFEDCTLNDLAFWGISPPAADLWSNWRRDSVDVTKFKKIDMMNSSFDSSYIRDAEFLNFNLVEQCKLVNSLFDHCKFNEFCIERKNAIYDSDFSACKFDGATFRTPIRKTTFMNCEFNDCHISLLDGAKFADLNTRTLQNTLIMIVNQRLSALIPSKRQQALKVINAKDKSDSVFRKCVFDAEKVNEKSQAVYRDVTFSGVSFVDTDFNSINFHNVSFQKCDIRGGHFLKCRLVDCDLVGSDFQNVIFDGCTVSKKNWDFLTSLEKRGVKLLGETKTEESSGDESRQSLLYSDIVPAAWNVTLSHDGVCELSNKFHPKLILKANYETVEPLNVDAVMISSASLSPENKNVGIVKYSYIDHGNEYTHCRAALIDLKGAKFLMDIPLPGYFSELEPEAWPKLVWSVDKLIVQLSELEKQEIPLK